MHVKGKTAAQNQDRLAQIVKEVGVDFPTAHARSEEVRQRWAKECDAPFKPRLPALGTTLAPSAPSEEDMQEDKAGRRRKKSPTGGIGRAKFADAT